MFCPECGAKNQDDAVFCESCGADISQALEQSRQVQPTKSAVPPQTQMTYVATPEGNQGYTYQSTSVAAKPRTPMKLRTKVSLVVLLMAAVLIAVFFYVGGQMNSADKIAKDYFETLRVQDWNKAYSYLDITESDFINRDNFIKMQKKYKNISKIVNYSTVKASKDIAEKTDEKTDKTENVLTETIVMKYTTQDSTSPQTMEINLIKQPEKKLLFFDTWKVSSASYITPSISITVPQGTTAYLDGIQIADKYKDTESQDNAAPADSQNSTSQPVTYKVKNIFSGDYTLKVTSKYTEDYTKDITVNGEDGSVTVDSLELKKEVLDTVAKQPEQVIQELYSAALAGKDFSSVKGYFVSNNDVQNNMANKYQNLLRNIARDNSPGFKSIDFSNFQSQVTESQAGSNMSVAVSLQFDYSYTAVGYSYDATMPAQQYTGKNSSTIQASFQMEDDKWLISDISDFALPYDNYGY